VSNRDRPRPARRQLLFHRLQRVRVLHLALLGPRSFPLLVCAWSNNERSYFADSIVNTCDGGVRVSESELLRARAKCFSEWAIKAEQADYAEYLSALAKECLEDAATLDAMQVENCSTLICRTVTITALDRQFREKEQDRID
jgi:hypothetical protein